MKPFIAYRNPGLTKLGLKYIGLKHIGLKYIATSLLFATLPACEYFSSGDNSADGLQRSGTVEMRETDVGFRVAGRIDQLLADEGDVVQVGQPLATLDDSNYQLVLQRAAGEFGGVAGWHPQAGDQGRPD